LVPLLIHVCTTSCHHGGLCVRCMSDCFLHFYVDWMRDSVAGRLQDAGFCSGALQDAGDSVAGRYRMREGLLCVFSTNGSFCYKKDVTFDIT
jgi:hypothetical protein